MEVYYAKYDYEKEREDILSFREGDRFQIASKADKKWWAAYALGSGEYGYVPSVYLERYTDPEEGEIAQELSESNVGDQKREALEELKRKVPLTPASSSNGIDEGEENRTPIIIKPLTMLSQQAEDCLQVEPKKLPNPHKESKLHVQLHKELKLSNARGGSQNLGKPELEKVMQRRKLDAEGKAGSIRGDQLTVGGRTTAANDELAAQLSRRSYLLEESSRQEERELNKPEFMRVSLRKTPQHC